MKILKKAFISAALLTAVCFGVLNMYAADFYAADRTAVECMAGTETVQVCAAGNTMVFQPENPKTGFIFYPGGKVEYAAYAPIMEQLAENGILCIITQMPYNLAVLDIDAADGLQAEYPQVKNWYIGGHSLGGSMAAGYVADNAADYSGLILLASYSTSDLSDSGLPVLSVYGSNDTVLNMEKYNKYKTNLSQDTQETVICGGNHAQFGSYGPQKGDGIATISAQEQLAQTITAIINFTEK